ncbi:MAG: hypothetical protein OFPI_00770 [Osedax symbiont Rs2]|nr:MAG: hypothetical protein OFPI_00770 [Osedax symbiont Rs2]
MLNTAKDFMWNHKALTLPFVSSGLCIIWLIMEPGPEPTVALLVSVLTFWSLFFQERDTWYTKTQGKLWVIVGRSGNQKDQDNYIKQTLLKFEPVAKYKIDSDSDFFTLTIDSYSSVKTECLITQARTLGSKLNSITKNGNCIWEYEEP